MGRQQEGSVATTNAASSQRALTHVEARMIWNVIPDFSMTSNNNRVTITLLISIDSHDWDKKHMETPRVPLSVDAGTLSPSQDWIGPLVYITHGTALCTAAEGLSRSRIPAWRLERQPFLISSVWRGQQHVTRLYRKLRFGAIYVVNDRTPYWPFATPSLQQNIYRSGNYKCLVLSSIATNVHNMKLSENWKYLRVETYMYATLS